MDLEDTVVELDKQLKTFGRVRYRILNLSVRSVSS